MRHGKVAGGEFVGDLAVVGMLGRGRRRHQRKRDRQQDWKTPRHASPPANSGLAAGGRGPGPRLSTPLYHVISAAKPTMMAMPAMLTAICVATRFDTSVNTKCPAKDKNTPRQNISSECWPHTITGHSNRVFKNGQSRGTNQTV